MTNLAVSDDDPLQDPFEKLLKDMRTNPADAAIIAQFLDIGVLVELFKKSGYGATKKIEILLEITEKGSPSEKMKAIKMLDEIWSQALVKRGMLGAPGVSPLLPGTVQPIGLPAPRQVQSVEMTSKKVRMVLGDVPDETEHAAPPVRQFVENTDHGKEADETDEYYPDARDENTNIARPPSGEFGRGPR